MIAALLGVALALAQETSGPADVREGPARTLFRIPRDGTQVVLRDLDGDLDLDLVFAEPAGFGARLLRDDGTYPASHDAFLPLPSARMAWDIADLGGDGRSEIVALVDGKEARAFALGPDGSFGAGELLIETQSYLPRGVSRLDFVRDIDGDGREDLVAPAAGRYRIHLGREGGGFSAPIAVVYEAEVDYEVGDPERLDARFGQSVRIPWFRIEDVDGDGRDDLVSETPDEVFFHVAEDGLPAEPSWKLDLAALRAERPERSGIDLDDLFANLDATIAWRIEDIDGRYPKDLVLQLGSTFRVHLGAARAGPERAPDQILKLSGNVLYFFVRDVEGSELPDLQLLRGPKISLGTVIRWLVLPGSLDFNLFTYVNEDGAFGRRPARENRVSIEIPRLLSFIDEIKELETQIEEQRKVPARRFAAQAGSEADDVVDLRDGALAIYLDRAQERGISELIGASEGDVDALVEALVLRDLDRQGDGGTKTIDLGELKEWRFSPGAALRDACAAFEPDERIPLDWSGAKMEIHAAHLGADGAPDFVVVGEEDGELGAVYVVQVLVRRP